MPENTRLGIILGCIGSFIQVGLQSVTGAIQEEEETPTPWVAEYREIIDPVTGEKLDDGIALFFKSFTTEDTLELRVHSGKAVLTAILRALSKLHFRQVEGLRDLIEAETKAQRKIAVYRVRRWVAGFIDLGEVVDELGQEDVLENGRRWTSAAALGRHGHCEDDELPTRNENSPKYGGGASTLKFWIVPMYKTGQLSYTDVTTATRLLSTTSSSLFAAPYFGNLHSGVSSTAAASQEPTFGSARANCYSGLQNWHFPSGLTRDVWAAASEVSSQR
ncbi:hypothetical protein EDD16DRAFT_1516244 [Pisolithus croceorrhizus]|nr:hypothetical protein EDD16DRAFT_1516244 [Pisolithus croceorrhizus]KAI6128606.1 hypothetical protein EV401DRAFT_1885203 [Pisolithus croceorrhizus]KAI6156438.1 hypothetical protein EDD17DRAFT_1899599 [Pisolithus thermaeus]